MLGRIQWILPMCVCCTCRWVGRTVGGWDKRSRAWGAYCTSQEALASRKVTLKQYKLMSRDFPKQKCHFKLQYKHLSHFWSPSNTCRHKDELSSPLLTFMSWSYIWFYFIFLKVVLFFSYILIHFAQKLFHNQTQGSIREY